MDTAEGVTQVIAASVMSPKGGVLRFFGRGGRVVLRAQPEGDGWWWLDGVDGAMIAAVGHERGRLHDLDGDVVASVGDETVSIGGSPWHFDVDARRVMPMAVRDLRPGLRYQSDDSVVEVERDSGVLKVSFRPPADRYLATLVALCLPLRSPYVTPADRPLQQETIEFLDDVGSVLWGLSRLLS